MEVVRACLWMRQNNIAHTLYNEFLIISIFISSRSCSDMQSLKNGAKNKRVHYPFKRQHHKMVKHTQTIHRRQPMNCLRVFDHFVWLALKGLLIRINIQTVTCRNLTKQQQQLWGFLPFNLFDPGDQITSTSNAFYTGLHKNFSGQFFSRCLLIPPKLSSNYFFW